jgi:hypothetical protein
MTVGWVKQHRDTSPTFGACPPPLRLVCAVDSMSLEDRIRGLQLEDRIHASVDEVLGELRTRIEGDLQHMVEQLVLAAAQEREEAIVIARRSAFDDGAQMALRQLADVEARLDRAVAEAREQERLLAEKNLADSRDEAEQRLSQIRAEAEGKEAVAVQESVKAARMHQREGEVAALTRLVESFRELDAASSLSETLDALARAASREAARSAVLVIRNDRMFGWNLSGFGERDAQPRALDIAVDDGSIVGQAAITARSTQTAHGDPAAVGPAFADLPHDCMAAAAPVTASRRSA